MSKSLSAIALSAAIVGCSSHERPKFDNQAVTSEERESIDEKSAAISNVFFGGSVTEFDLGERSYHAYRFHCGEIRNRLAVTLGLMGAERLSDGPKCENDTGQKLDPCPSSFDLGGGLRADVFIGNALEQSGGNSYAIASADGSGIKMPGDKMAQVRLYLRDHIVFRGEEEMLCIDRIPGGYESHVVKK